MTSKRQLAAIMFTDIVGYTALMGDDEQKAFGLLNKNRQIHQPIIDTFNGKLIKELGDGILASFPTVSDALFAAIKIQQACLASKELSLRVGVHVGEIIIENNDIYGDAVNIASRIQTLGIPGSILFSKKVADEIKNKTEFHTVSLGGFEFKNVHEPIEIFALANDGFPVPKRSLMDGKLKKKTFKNRNVILSLSFMLLAVAAFIIYKKIFEKNNGAGIDKSIDTTGSSTNTEVYNLILQGNYFHDKLDKENLQKSVDFYRQALAIDSTDAKAWAYLANSLTRMAWNNDIDQLTGYEEAREAALKAIAFDANTAAGHRALGAIKFYHDFDWRGAKEEFEKALNIEPNNAEVLSVYSVWHQAMGDYTTAISLTKEALSNDPLKPLYYRVYGGNLTYVSRLEDAIAMFRKGLELNPHSLGENYLIGRNYILVGKPEKALAFFSNEPFEMSKQMGYNLYYHATGRKKEADEALVNFINEYNEEWPYNIAVIYGFRGDKNNTINWLEKAFNKKDTRLVLIKNEPLLKNIWKDPRYINLLKKMNLLN